MSILTVIIFCLVLLLFNTTRLFASLVLGSMAYVYPLLLIPIIVFSGIYFYCTHLK
jgi:hypothetical protein